MFNRSWTLDEVLPGCLSDFSDGCWIWGCLFCFPSSWVYFPFQKKRYTVIKKKKKKEKGVPKCLAPGSALQPRALIGTSGAIYRATWLKRGARGWGGKGGGAEERNSEIHQPCWFPWFFWSKSPNMKTTLEKGRKPIFFSPHQNFPPCTSARLWT